MIPLRQKNTIAGAVARAILRTEADPSYLIAEQVAYKCALIAKGCDAQTICEDAKRDFEWMRELAFRQSSEFDFRRLVNHSDHVFYAGLDPSAA